MAPDEGASHGERGDADEGNHDRQPRGARRGFDARDNRCSEARAAEEQAAKEQHEHARRVRRRVCERDPRRSAPHPNATTAGAIHELARTAVTVGPVAVVVTLTGPAGS